SQHHRQAEGDGDDAGEQRGLGANVHRASLATGESNPRDHRLRRTGGPFTLRGVARPPVLLPLAALLLAAAPEPSPAAADEQAPAVEQGLVPDDVGEVWNPAFPSRPPPVPLPATGRQRVDLRMLEPVFTGELAAPRAEFEAGRYERAVQLLAPA